MAWTRRGSAAGHHLRLRQRGHLVLADAGRQLQLHDLTRLVRLDVRPQPAEVAGHPDCLGDVVFDV